MLCFPNHCLSTHFSYNGFYKSQVTAWKISLKIVHSLFLSLPKTNQEIQGKRAMSDPRRCTAANYCKYEKSSTHDNRSCLWGSLYLHLAVLAVGQIPHMQGNSLTSMGKKKKIPIEALTKLTLSAEERIRWILQLLLNSLSMLSYNCSVT